MSTAQPGVESGGGKSGVQGRIDELTSRWRETQRARDSAIQQVQELTAAQESHKTEVAALKQAIEELRSSVTPKRPANPWPEYSDMDDSALWQAATGPGPADPITGQAGPQHPAVTSRALSELIERRAKALAEKIAGDKVGQLEGRLTAQQKQAAELQLAEQRLRSVYGAAVDDAQSPLRQMAAKLAGPLAQEYGRDYLQTRAGLQHVFSEAQRLLHAEAIKAHEAEVSRLRQETARLAGIRGPEHSAAAPPDEVKDALKKGDWRAAIRAGSLSKSLLGQGAAQR